MEATQQSDEVLMKHYFKGMKISEPQTYENMTIVPVSDAIEHKIDYISLSEAIEKDYITIKEVDESASVSNLKVINKSDRNVLIIDGEQFVGAKQNRIINATVFIPGNSKLIINVSCVEEGRWSYVSDKFDTSDNILEFGTRVRKMKNVNASLRRSEAFIADQGEIWDNVHEMISVHRIRSDTAAMEDVYINKKNSIDKYTNTFSLLEKQNGLIVFINGEAVGIEFISLPEVFEINFDKIIRSYALHSIGAKENTDFSKDFLNDAKQFIDEFTKCNIEKFKSTGKGYDFRLTGQKVRGSSLVVDNEIIHFVGFTTQNGKQRKRTGKWFDTDDIPPIM